MLSDLVNRSTPLGPDAQVLVLGGGYSGRSFVQLVKALGTPVRSTRRHADSPGADLVFDSGTGQIPNPAELKGVSHVLCTIPPTADGQDPVLSCLGSMLQDLPLTWVGYLSTTGVYGDRQGAWVTEAEPASPGQ
ncbi:MAG: SDR family NAD(P)-dependent oxidoreductase, partial [Synechococcus sp.]|nr:SDR family NAD(P)-dependent oxidoreductase [Synechococcus sp.]